MKNSIITSALLVCLSFFSTNVNASKLRSNSDSSVCLEINGKLSNLNIDGDKSYRVELISNNNVIESKTLKNKREFTFKLKKNTHYAVRVTKVGFVPKVISIFTDSPKEVNDLFRLQFDVELIHNSETKDINKDALDFPTVVVSYSPEGDRFDYDKKYSANLMNEMYLKKRF